MKELYEEHFRKEAMVQKWSKKVKSDNYIYGKQQRKVKHWKNEQIYNAL